MHQEVNCMCEKFFAKHGQWFVLVSRILFGVLFFCHGLMKFGFFEGGFVPVYSIYWFAGIIELIVGAALVLGIGTRYASMLGAADMLGAWFIAHAPSGWNPFSNGGELAVLYLSAFLVFMTIGAGRISLDRKVGLK